MGLVNGEIHGDEYAGTAVCDLCGHSEGVKVHGERIKGKKPWRDVAFKYARWVACSDPCESGLKPIRDREAAKDKEGGTQSYQLRTQRRLAPIPGTWGARAAGGGP